MSPLTVLLLVKGVLGLVSVVLLVIHMQAAARAGQVVSLGQSLRYIALLLGGVLIGYRSIEQLQEDGFRWQFSVGLGFVFSAVLLLAAVTSVWETRKYNHWPWRASA